MPVMDPPERREHSRYPVRAEAKIAHASQCYGVELRDMSMNGASLCFAGELPMNEGDDITLSIELEDFQAPGATRMLANQPRKVVRLRGTLMHCESASQGALAGVEYWPISEVDQVLLTLLLARPDD